MSQNEYNHNDEHLPAFLVREMDAFFEKEYAKLEEGEGVYHRYDKQYKLNAKKYFTKLAHITKLKPKDSPYAISSIAKAIKQPVLDVFNKLDLLRENEKTLEFYNEWISFLNKYNLNTIELISTIIEEGGELIDRAANQDKNKIVYGIFNVSLQLLKHEVLKDAHMVPDESMDDVQNFFVKHGVNALQRYSYSELPDGLEREGVLDQSNHVDFTRYPLESAIEKAVDTYGEVLAFLVVKTPLTKKIKAFLDKGYHALAPMAAVANKGEWYSVPGLDYLEEITPDIDPKFELYSNALVSLSCVYDESEYEEEINTVFPEILKDFLPHKEGRYSTNLFILAAECIPDNHKLIRLYSNQGARLISDLIERKFYANAGEVVEKIKQGNNSINKNALVILDPSKQKPELMAAMFREKTRDKLTVTYDQSVLIVFGENNQFFAKNNLVQHSGFNKVTASNEKTGINLKDYQLKAKHIQDEYRIVEDFDQDYPLYDHSFKTLIPKLKN